jgi:hypothetical protein
MTCLQDIHIQALADGEGSSEMAHHAASCVRCAARLRAREATMTALGSTLNPPVGMPPSVAARVDLRHGATRLREEPRRKPAAGRWLYGSLAIAAATILAVLFVAPSIRQADATGSAAEILARSATQRAAAPTTGVEVLEYELLLDGVPKEMMPDQTDGAYRIWQAIDHNVPGRFRFASYAPDGKMVSSIAEDPAAGRRVAAFSVEGQAYRFDVSLPNGARNLSLPEMQRLHMQASIARMQASGNQLIETIDGPNGKLYRVEVPRVSDPSTNPVWDLSEARVLIDARDYSIVEFAVHGSFLKQDYSLSYKQLKHVSAASLDANAFAVPHQDGEIVISGEGTAAPSHDVFLLSLRELTRLKQGR